MSTKSTECIINFSDIEAKRVSQVKEMDEKKTTTQQIYYPRYNHPTMGENQQFIIQFPWIHIDAYGIPSKGKYYEKDSDRSHIRLPLDASKPKVAILIEKLKELDKYFSSEAFASSILGDKWKKYKYNPIFRDPSADADEDDKPSDGKVRKPYIKLKLFTDYLSGDIKTKLFKVELNEDEKITNQTACDDVKTIDDVSGIITYLSNIRAIAQGVKFWVLPVKKEWGFTLKVIKAQVQPSSKKSSAMKSFMTSDAFLDSDDEGGKKIVKEVKKVSSLDSDDDKPVKKSSKKEAEVESSDDDSEDDSEDSDDDKPVSNKGKQASKKVNDSDSEDDKPAKAKPATKATRGGKGGKSAHA
jgi:hypothetical protein